MIIRFFGIETYEGLLQKIYDTTLDKLREKVRTSYAPDLIYYEDYDRYGFIELIPKSNSSLVRKPFVNTGDIINVDKLIISKDKTLLKFGLELVLQTRKDFIVEDLVTSRLEDMLYDAITTSFEDSLINNQFIITLKEVNISATYGTGDLIIYYTFVALDEAAIKPGGNLYKEIKTQTKVGK